MEFSQVYSINVCQNFLGWSIASSAWFVAGLMLVSGLFNLAFGKVMRLLACSDVTVLVSSQLIACFSCIFLFNFDLVPRTPGSLAVYSESGEALTDLP